MDSVEKDLYKYIYWGRYRSFFEEGVLTPLNGKKISSGPLKRRKLQLSSVDMKTSIKSLRETKRVRNTIP